MIPEYLLSSTEVRSLFSIYLKLKVMEHSVSMLDVSSKPMNGLQSPMLRSYNAIPLPNACYAQLFLQASQSVTYVRLYRVHSFHSLGIAMNMNELCSAPQAYAVGSAAGPTLVEDKSNIVGTANSIPASAVEHKQPEGAGDEQVSATLSWTSRNAERILTPEHNGQQPIVPTQKKGLSGIKPSSKEDKSTIIQKESNACRSRMLKW